MLQKEGGPSPPRDSLWYVRKQPLQTWEQYSITLTAVSVFIIIIVVVLLVPCARLLCYIQN